MSDIDAALSHILGALNAARQTRQRRLVVLSGECEWGRAILEHLLNEVPVEDGVWVGETAPIALPTVAAGKARALLGRNLALVVYDARAGLNPDALAAVAGAISGGGLLILLTPALAQWRRFPDPDYRRVLVHPFKIDAIAGRFLNRLIDSLCNDPDVFLLEQGLVPALTRPDSIAERWSSQAGTTPDQPDQQRAVEAVLHVVTGHSRRPLVMTSDRGRGKSSALGIAAGRILQGGSCQLVITAPRLAAVAPAFYHAARELGLEAPVSQSDHIEIGEARLRFVPPDELLRHPIDCDLLMVDEAAAIPAPILERLTRRYNRTVFATTTHGYEGTGRGFEVRFKPRLHQLANQVRELHLSQPIRWADKDPVERWLFDALLLDAGPADIDAGESGIDRNTVIECVDRDELVRDTETLRQLFGLLVLAHYQTTPSDLRNLLDGPNISVWLARHRGRVIAAALMAAEGGFDEELAQAVWRGERRPRGHLMAQTLAAHAGFQEAPLLHYWRVMRIAVHPQLQRRGLGGELMRQIVDAARVQSVDLVGSSFAATADVLAFWRSVQCVPVRVGYSRDASSGCHSALVLSALTDNGLALLGRARSRFAEQFPRALETQFTDLESELVTELLHDLPLHPGYAMQQQDWLDVEMFARGGRQLADCRLALWKLVIRGWAIGAGLQLESTVGSIMLRVIVQCRSENEVCAEEGLSGKKALREKLKLGVTRLREVLLNQA